MKKLCIPLLAGVFALSAAVPFAVQAARYGSGGFGAGAGLQTQSRSQDQDRLRLRDGSCLTTTGSPSGSPLKQGNTYGPGDGTGNAGVGPKDGTGYGAPSNR